MTHTTVNTTPAVMQEKYSSFIVENLPEILLPTNFYRNVTEFGDGDTLNIPTIGTVTLQEAQEGVPLEFNPIDSGRVSLSITDQIGDAWGVTDDLKEDGYLVNQLLAARAMESTRAIGEERETKFLAACNSAQTAGNSSIINGASHRRTATGTVAGGSNAERVITLEDFAYMAYAFNKAKVRQGGRIAIVTPEVAATMSDLYNSTWVSNNPAFEGIITTGFSQEHKFVANVHGWDVWVSNLLPEVGVEALNVTTVAGDKANIFMCVSDDQTTPMMFAERRSPSVEAWRDNEERTDKYQVTERYGWGAQRVDTLGVLITNGTSF